MDYLRMMAGGITGAGGIMLLWQGHTDAGVAILAGMMGFFIGEKNGEKKNG